MQAYISRTREAFSQPSFKSDLNELGVSLKRAPQFFAWLEGHTDFYELLVAEASDASVNRRSLIDYAMFGYMLNKCVATLVDDGADDAPLRAVLVESFKTAI